MSGQAWKYSDQLDDMDLKMMKRDLISPEPKKQSVQKEYGNCRFCPYGKHQPCIGYCISKLYREVKRKR